MSIWSTLGIHPTTDPREIEEAFEQQLKFVDQDAEPGRYRELRSAYERAMLEAGAEPLDEDFGHETQDPEEVTLPGPPDPDTEMHAGQVMTELETLFANPGWRDDLKRWRAQLEGAKAHKPGVTEVLRFRVFDFISRQAKNVESGVSPELLVYLDERLGWTSHRAQLEKAFSQERVEAMLGQRQGGKVDVGPFQSPGDEPQAAGMPKGLGLAMIGWIALLMVLTMLFGEMR